jgi:N-acetylglucosaminyldiphosphoundecaprenol N-acetyl-beta-D-mannosaminyltransferase
LRIDFLGTPIDSVNMQDALERVDEFILARKPHHVLVTNANKFWLMGRDARLKAIAYRADLILPERAIAVCARILGMPLKDDVAGVAFAKELLSHCEKQGHSIYLLGATTEVQRCLLEMVRREYPGLKVAGSHDGYFLNDRNDAVLEDIRSKKPDVLIVAMGSPVQEYWIRENIDKDEMNVPVSVGVGGSFDVIAGLKKDAPQWVRKSGFEWLFRLLQDPKQYWRRYLRIVPYLIFAVLVRGVLGFGRSGKGAKDSNLHFSPETSSVPARKPERADS